jgi:hypothetical protein
LPLLFCCSLVSYFFFLLLCVWFIFILITIKRQKKRTNRYHPTYISIGLSEQQFKSWCLKGLLYNSSGSGISPLLSMLYLCACHLTWRTAQFVSGKVILYVVFPFFLSPIEWPLNCMKYNYLLVSLIKTLSIPFSHTLILTRYM